MLFGIRTIHPNLRSLNHLHLHLNIRGQLLCVSVMLPSRMRVYPVPTNIVSQALHTRLASMQILNRLNAIKKNCTNKIGTQTLLSVATPKQQAQTIVKRFKNTLLASSLHSLGSSTQMTKSLLSWSYLFLVNRFEVSSSLVSEYLHTVWCN